MDNAKPYKRRKPNKQDYNYSVTVELTEEEFIIFEREWLQWMKFQNVKVTRSNFMRKIFRDFVSRKYAVRRKRLSRYYFKDY